MLLLPISFDQPSLVNYSCLILSYPTFSLNPNCCQTNGISNLTSILSNFQFQANLSSFFPLIKPNVADSKCTLPSMLEGGCRSNLCHLTTTNTHSLGSSVDPLPTHGGTGQNLFVKWNTAAASPSISTSLIDIMIYLHGYNSLPPSSEMTWAKYTEAGLNLETRTFPAIGIVPRGKV